MKGRLLEILEDIRPDVDFLTEKHLIDGKVLQSFDIVTLVSEINDEFDIEIGPRELTADNFNSIDSIIQMIERLQDD